MISVDNLTVSFGGWDLFKDISFLINPKDRIGLVGKNGAGKSTMLKVLAGEQPPTSGGVSRNGDCTIGYLPQQMKVADTTTLYAETEVGFRRGDRPRKGDRPPDRADRRSGPTTRAPSTRHCCTGSTTATDRFQILGGQNREAEVEKTLLGLGFKREDFTRATSEFSGGWRMRIELAKLLLRRPSLFLLDEPTNHLDIESIQWLEGYLKEYNGGGGADLARPRVFRQRHHAHDRDVARQGVTTTRCLTAGMSSCATNARAAADGRLPEPAEDDRADRGVHRALPLQAHQVESGPVAHQATREDRAHRDRRGRPRAR